MSDKQKTIKNSFSIKGKGLHTGEEVTLTVKPAEADFGYKFCRIDLEGQPIIPALAENVVDTSRSTVIGIKDAKVSTVEHVLSVFYALGIDNVLFEIDGPEVPILNGSAKTFLDEIEKVGIEELEAEKTYFVIKEKFTYSDVERGIEIVSYPEDSLYLDVKIGYDSPVLNNQYATFNINDDFGKEIAPARTFCFFREIEYLAKNNLIKGGDIDNAIVIVDHNVSQDEIDRISNLFDRHDVRVDKQGILNNIELNFENEPARHKLLDLMGDLALCGQPIKGRIIATHPGHKANTEFAKEIRQVIKQNRKKILPPDIDIFGKPVADIEEIRRRLPHRYPFLLIDKILKLTETQVIGIKNVTANEEYFLGHFPKESVMPGVLQIEAMAQCGGILVLDTVPDPENYLTFFLTIDKIKFRQKVVPGDTILFKLDLLAPIRRGIAHMKAQAFVGENLVSEGELMAQIAKK
jgi:UDP-3-O-[3-hydroxymyristoyl] N-acetylglucosamine deacetylase / 3-hydroxyacyl-[acyl-carrier-protein] dehydratase